jgi:hypothetical protein
MLKQVALEEDIPEAAARAAMLNLAVLAEDIAQEEVYFFIH